MSAGGKGGSHETEQDKGYDGGCCERTAVVKQVIANQRADAGWNQAWVNYCKVHGQGISDPASLTVQFIVKACCALGPPQVVYQYTDAMGMIQTVWLPFVPNTEECSHEGHAEDCGVLAVQQQIGMMQLQIDAARRETRDEQHMVSVGTQADGDNKEKEKFTQLQQKYNTLKIEHAMLKRKHEVDGAVARATYTHDVSAARTRAQMAQRDNRQLRQTLAGVQDELAATQVPTTGRELFDCPMD